MIQMTERQALQAKVDQCRRLSAEVNDPTTTARLLILMKELEQKQLDLPK